MIFNNCIQLYNSARKYAIFMYTNVTLLITIVIKNEVTFA